MLTIKSINSSLRVRSHCTKAMVVKWITRISSVNSECDILIANRFAFAIVQCEWILNIMTEILNLFSYVSVLLFIFVDL